MSTSLPGVGRESDVPFSDLYVRVFRSSSTTHVPSVIDYNGLGSVPEAPPPLHPPSVNRPLSAVTPS